MKHKINTTFKEWITIAPHTAFQMQEFSRPYSVGKRREKWWKRAKPVLVPNDLWGISMSQLIDLSELEDGENGFYKVCNVLLGLTVDEVNKARAVDVVKLCGWVYTEVKKINEIFSNIPKPDLTNDEQMAGFGEKDDNGLFNMLDWYARRMGIQDQDDAAKVGWSKIYAAIKKDNEDAIKQRRLIEIQNRNNNKIKRS